MDGYKSFLIKVKKFTSSYNDVTLIKDPTRIWIQFIFDASQKFTSSSDDMTFIENPTWICARVRSS